MQFASLVAACHDAGDRHAAYLSWLVGPADRHGKRTLSVFYSASNAVDMHDAIAAVLANEHVELKRGTLREALESNQYTLDALRVAPAEGHGQAVREDVEVVLFATVGDAIVWSHTAVRACARATCGGVSLAGPCMCRGPGLSVRCVTRRAASNAASLCVV